MASRDRKYKPSAESDNSDADSYTDSAPETFAARSQESSQVTSDMTLSPSVSRSLEAFSFAWQNLVPQAIPSE